jgi:mRNA-degrading endonuclease YafQ of YafQ-DinJ toxin-antitoxin module
MSLGGHPKPGIYTTVSLKEPYEGLRSIDITNDYRAIYEEVPSGTETIAYFSLIGTHDELYG